MGAYYYKLIAIFGFLYFYRATKVLSGFRPILGAIKALYSEVKSDCVGVLIDGVEARGANYFEVIEI